MRKGKCELKTAIREPAIATAPHSPSISSSNWAHLDTVFKQTVAKVWSSAFTRRIAGITGTA
jgi:hypothetical protein